MPASEQEFVQQLNGSSGLTPAQLAELANGEVKAGRLTQEQAGTMLAADGIDGGAPAELGGFEPARPEHYVFPKPAGEMTPKDRQADMQLRNWLAGAKFPRDIGSTLAAEASRVLKQHAGMDETARELYKRNEAVQLERMWGSKFGERVALARQLLTELDATPQGKGILDFIDRSGLGNSAMVINLVFAQAERLAARQSGKAAK
jgi:hypothetical protein